MTAGLFGKIPSKADFVQHQGATSVARDLDRWLREGIEGLRNANLEQPSSPVRFVFHAGGDQCLVGVFGPSQDQVGRHFPLSIFAFLEAKDYAKDYARLPVMYDAFLEHAAHLVSNSAQLDFATLSARVDQLPLPGSAEASQAAQICSDTLNGSPVAELNQRVFGDLSDGRHYYALQTFLTACDEAKGAAPDKPGTVVDCPISIDVDLFTWLELSSRRLQWTQGPPSFFWIEEPAPRLLLSLGPVAGVMLSLLSNPTQDNPRLWPLSTTRPAAIDAARKSISGKLDPFGHGTTAMLGQLIDAMAR